MIVMEHLNLTVTGMTCGGCENAVRRVVSTIAGVTHVAASHQDDRVTVDYDAAKADRTTITRAIEAAGYNVT